MVIFSLTVYKSWRRGDRVHKSVFTLLLRDGAIYFGIIAIIELVTVIPFHVASACKYLLCISQVYQGDLGLFQEYQRGDTATLANVVASIMISRLMLNLRDPENLKGLTQPTYAAPSTLVFNAAASDATSTTSDDISSELEQ
ncbi:hypothetical protein C0992_010246 [Termitomyces sp. T32_za158]|nr:hypothetical protein C0992_010246 [Termitomyces sp. T32_za158]